MDEKTKKIYLMHSAEIGAYKIGVSKNPIKRLETLSTGCPYSIDLIYKFVSKRPFMLEGALHSTYVQYKRNIDGDPLSGEWFDLPTNEVIGFLDKCRKLESTMEFLAEAGNPFI